MKYIRKNRKYRAGINNTEMTHVGFAELKNDEVLTVKINKEKEYDVARKKWGFYGTPSLNKRLLRFGLLAAITYNPNYQSYFVMIVEHDKKKTFLKYVKGEGMKVICWLNKRNLNLIKKKFI